MEGFCLPGSSQSGFGGTSDAIVPRKHGSFFHPPMDASGVDTYEKSYPPLFDNPTWREKKLLQNVMTLQSVFSLAYRAESPGNYPGSTGGLTGIRRGAR